MLATCGRAEPVKLLLEDAGISFDYKRFEFSEWPAVKQSLIDSKNRVPTMPYVTTKSGEFFGRTAPLMRMISKDIGKYIPSSPEDEYLADAYSDVYLDWETKWLNAVFSSDKEELAKHETESRPALYSNWNDIFGDRNGPYIFGDEISYADFMVYTVIKDDYDAAVDAGKYPNIAKFIMALEARPTLKASFV